MKYLFDITKYIHFTEFWRQLEPFVDNIIIYYAFWSQGLIKRHVHGMTRATILMRVAHAHTTYAQLLDLAEATLELRPNATLRRQNFKPAPNLYSSNYTQLCSFKIAVIIFPFICSCTIYIYYT